ncbi:MAG: hypothetical protein QOG30_2588 [Acidimicrobiaceae bacterium]
MALLVLLAAAALAVIPAPAQADAPGVNGGPSWWDGDCDANHWNAAAASQGWTGEGAHRLGASYLNVAVCGPRRSGDGAPDVRWSRTGWGHYEWECVELTMRFMAQIYGVSAYGANGNQVVTNYSTSYGGGLQKVNNGTPGVAPLPGDVIAFDDPGRPNVTVHYGHAAVVTATAVDKNGNGTITMMSQNDSTDGWRKVTVTNWTVGGFGYEVTTGWLHDPQGRGASWANISLPPGDGPAAASRGDGSTDVFARGADDAVWTRRLANGKWSGWSSLGGIITTAAASASAQPGTLDMVVRGLDNALWTRRLTAGVWSEWSSLGGIVTTAPSMISSGAGTMELYARGADNAVWTRHLANGGWEPWKSLGGIVTTSIGAASSSPGVVDVFAQGADRALWTGRVVDGVWGGWISMGGIITTSPGAVSSDAGVVDVFARGGDNALWTRHLANGTWGPWTTWGWVVASPVAAVSVTAGSLDLYARGPDGALWTVTLPGSGTPNAISLGGIIR